jgi:hypothetical protein
MSKIISGKHYHFWDNVNSEYAKQTKAELERKGYKVRVMSSFRVGKKRLFVWKPEYEK